MRLKHLALPIAVTLSVGFARLASAGEEKCTIAITGDSPTAKACKEGGRKAAGKLMKQMVKTAKAKGVSFTCDSCHKDNEDFKLTDNAKKDYDKLLAAQK